MTENILKNEVAIVTGAGEGIGFEIARQLALHGASVVLNDRDEEEAREAAEKIKKQGGKIIHAHGDSSDMKVIENMVKSAMDEFGKLTLVVANAGVTIPGSVFDYSLDDFEKTVNVNLKGTYFLTQLAAKQMKNQGSGGGFIYMSSVNGIQANKTLSAYAMTKAGLLMLAKNLVAELSEYGIRVNCVSPGAILTERTTEEDKFEESWKEVTPLSSVSSTKDIADAVLFLAGSGAKNITGQNITVDGGWTAVSPAPPNGII